MRAIRMLKGAIDMFKPKKIMIEGNKNDAEFLSKYFEIMIRRDRTECAHPPIVACQGVLFKQPGALSREVVDAVLHPLAWAVEKLAPTHRKQHTGEETSKVQTGTLCSSEMFMLLVECDTRSESGRFLAEELPEIRGVFGGRRSRFHE